jgi:uncharacterized membrane protein
LVRNRPRPTQSILRMSAHALKATLSRPALVALLALALTGARLLLQPAVGTLARALTENLVRDTSLSQPLALLALTALFGCMLVSVVAGAVLSVLDHRTPMVGLAEALRSAPAFAVSGIAPAIGFAAAVCAELITIASVALHASRAPSLATHVLLVLVGPTSGALALFCALTALLALHRLAKATEHEPQAPSAGFIAIGHAALALLSHPLRALGLANSALLVTLPLTMLVAFTLPWSWMGGSERTATLWTFLGQSLCISATLITVARTISVGLANPANSACAGPTSHEADRTPLTNAAPGHGAGEPEVLVRPSS